MSALATPKHSLHSPPSIVSHHQLNVWCYSVAIMKQESHYTEQVNRWNMTNLGVIFLSQPCLLNKNKVKMLEGTNFQGQTAQPPWCKAGTLQRCCRWRRNLGWNMLFLCTWRPFVHSCPPTLSAIQVGKWAFFHIKPSKFVFVIWLWLDYDTQRWYQIWCWI